MKYHKQQILHNPEQGQYGDCFRTALACLMDRDPEEVPHFFNGKDEPAKESWKKVQDWLAGEGFHLFTAAYAGELTDIFRTMKFHNPGIYYLLAGSSGRGSHQVIAMDDGIVHDPHPANTGLIGPDADGYYWVNLLLPNFHGV